MFWNKKMSYTYFIALTPLYSHFFCMVLPRAKVKHPTGER